jgi:hypothetical protein
MVDEIEVLCFVEEEIEVAELLMVEVKVLKCVLSAIGIITQLTSVGRNMDILPISNTKIPWLIIMLTLMKMILNLLLMKKRIMIQIMGNLFLLHNNTRL